MAPRSKEDGLTNAPSRQAFLVMLLPGKKMRGKTLDVSPNCKREITRSGQRWLTRGFSKGNAFASFHLPSSIFHLPWQPFGPATKRGTRSQVDFKSHLFRSLLIALHHPSLGNLHRSQTRCFRNADTSIGHPCDQTDRSCRMSPVHTGDIPARYTPRLRSRP